jgi:hypothetical protein
VSWPSSVCCFKTANKGRMLQRDPRGPSEDGKRWRSFGSAGTYEGAPAGNGYAENTWSAGILPWRLAIIQISADLVVAWDLSVNEYGPRSS